jgi:flagellar assembly protein FliH
MDYLQSSPRFCPHPQLVNFRRAATTLVEIAFEAVCKMLGEKAATRDGVLALVRQATAKIAGGELLKIRLHPDDLALLQESGALTTALASSTRISWVADKTVEMGGCAVETTRGDVDARLEVQIRSLAAVLGDARRQVAR